MDFHWYVSCIITSKSAHTTAWSYKNISVVPWMYQKDTEKLPPIHGNSFNCWLLNKDSVSKCRTLCFISPTCCFLGATEATHRATFEGAAYWWCLNPRSHHTGECRWSAGLIIGNKVTGTTAEGYQYSWSSRHQSSCYVSSQQDPEIVSSITCAVQTSWNRCWTLYLHDFLSQ